MSPVFNKEQADEVLRRFKELVPELVKDSRYVIGVRMNPLGVYIPIIYLARDTVAEGAMPIRYVYILKKGESAFHILMEGMFNVFGVGIASKWWPNYVTAEELATSIISTWDQWLRINNAFAEDLQRKKDTLNDSQPF
jgi:hypothetical protein